MSSPFHARSRLYRVVYSVGQLLCAAPRLIEEGIHAPIRLRERVGAILRAAQQQRQRDAFLPLTAAITGILIDVCRNIRGARVGIHILVGEGIHPQIDAKLLREPRERLLRRVAQLHGAELLRLIVEHAILDRRQGGNAQCRQEQQREQQGCTFSLHVRPPIAAVSWPKTSRWRTAARQWRRTSPNTAPYPQAGRPRAFRSVRSWQKGSPCRATSY